MVKESKPRFVWSLRTIRNILSQHDTHITMTRSFYCLLRSHSLLVSPYDYIPADQMGGTIADQVGVKKNNGKTITIVYET